MSESEKNVEDPSDIVPNNKLTNNMDSSDEDSTPVLRVKRRLQCFTGSDSDTDKENEKQTQNTLSENEDEVKGTSPLKSKGRIILKDNSESDSDKQMVKNEEQQLRMKNKRNKLREKFKKLVTSRTKEGSNNDTAPESDENDNSSNDSNDEESSINNIKQVIKKSMGFKPSICDPDTSDEEDDEEKLNRLKSKPINQRKSTKPTSPKPSRMSAKQAMENMKKIKSESNRLLREKEITLPYHRPKAISLKDIMSRRKAAVTADGKALPIKMNEQQLKQYVEMLEQRQKEIMELCKSDSDGEQETAAEENDKPSDTQNIETSDRKTLDNQVTNVNNNNEFIVEKENHKGIVEEKSYETYESVEENIDNQGDNELQPECSSDNTLRVDNSNVEDKVMEAIDNDITDEIVQQNMTALQQISRTCTEPDSQNLKLKYDSESCSITDSHSKDISKENENNHENEFSDDEINMDDIDKLIENAEITNDKTYENNTKMSTNMAAAPLNIKPKLTGGPGMVIDLDDCDPDTSKKLSGVELLKERFTYFSKLKTPEELEREKEKKLKPGAQHLRLKQELEGIIAEQRSLEWAKRLNEEKQQQQELKALRGEESDGEEDIEKIEAKLDEKEVEDASETSEEEQESEPEENDVLIKENEKPRNAMIDDEAEESDCDDDTDINAEDTGAADEDNEDETSCGDQSSEESSEDESEDEEQTNKTRKGRILKAFEDSDDETANEQMEKIDSTEVSTQRQTNEKEHNSPVDKVLDKNIGVEKIATSNNMEIDIEYESQIFKDSQDEDIQLAQRMVSASDDMFTSQESATMVARETSQYDNDDNMAETQSFSILNPNNSTKDVLSNTQSIDKISFLSDTQTLNTNLEAGTFTQNLIPSQLASSQQPIGESQAIGEDVLALCTGKFYDNEFISQSEEKKDDGLKEAINDSFDASWSHGETQENNVNSQVDTISLIKDDEQKDNSDAKRNNEPKNYDVEENAKEENSKLKTEDHNLLQSIIDELHDEHELTSLKPNKYFASNDKEGDNHQVKKKFIIESDDETNDGSNGQMKTKKRKKRKLEQRALQISDDEEEQSENGEDMSDLDDDADRVVEYDSEENEIEVKQQNPKKKSKAADFFENEAELTSEDEWVGSGDEDEADLDRMEREEGDDETFHEGKLQRKLGQIHMRDILDQDKREVRLIQELLFEDGDLGGGGRQRKFRWKNADDEDETGPVHDEFATPEEEFESEEQWRKQRHEREVFLRQMQEQDKKEDSPNVTLNRSTIIKANLTSRTMTSLLMEANKSAIKTLEKNEGGAEKTTKDIPSPKRGFTILQQNYHSSLLTRGRGTLARLAALATPLAVDEDSTKVAAVAPKNQRNFVFATVAKDEVEPKVSKRKAESKLDTPRLVKKLKTNDKQTLSRNSLLDHLRA